MGHVLRYRDHEGEVEMADPSRRGRRMLPSLVVVMVACSSEPHMPSGPGPSPVPQPTATLSCEAPPACGLDPPTIVEPAEGAVVAGIVTVVSTLPENPCVITASAVVTVVDAGGGPVFSGWDNDVPARVRWDTTRVANGPYAVRVQRGCGACPAESGTDALRRRGHRANRDPDHSHAGVRENRPMEILDAIGNTSLVRLRKVVPAGCGQVLAKLEWENPTGSVKDRMALAVIGRAEADGRLKPGDRVVEYTGGSTGTSLALVCAAKGYRIHIVTSDAFSKEKRDHMAALGAELTLVPSEGGRTTKKLILDMIEAARDLSRRPRTYWTDQLNNHDSVAGYHALGEEIWTQTDGRVDAFVHCVGTAASSRGVASVLKRHKPGVRIVAVEPAESSVLLGGPAGPHKIEGVGIGYTPPLWEPALVDEVVAVATDDAKEMARRLAREEALFAGTSSGANVVAALRVAERLGPDATVVTLMADSGLKYLSTDVYGL
jgi:cysteine synthase A